LERQIRSGSRSVTKTASVVEALDELVSLADQAADQDPKLQELLGLIQAIRKEDPAASILIYTEYVDSLNAVTKYLSTKDVGEVMTICGDDKDSDRRKTTERFRTQERLILVSTDAAAEGLNLHQRCHNLIHLELPFNPNRLEQRNGRIDRYGQEHDPIVRYIYLRGTFEERILLRLIVKYERQRERLTFVPNTLGIETSTEIGSSRLLKGLMDEDTRLFQVQEQAADFLASEGPVASDEATQELLQEIDRSLKTFEQAARTHAWLGDAGLNAEEKLLSEATEAREKGTAAGIVDLAAFVRDAVLFDGGDLKGSIDSPVFRLTLPPAWSHGLEETIGYDPETRTVRLTTSIEVISDGDRNPVAFLGRAHPLVRRALDRVRSITYGSGADALQDHRVSAVQRAVPAPELLFTFLARVASRAGRELERVIGVRLPQAGQPEVLLDASQWSGMADPECGIRTVQVWERHFAPWAGSAQATCRSAAAAQFAGIAKEYAGSFLRKPCQFIVDTELCGYREKAKLLQVNHEAVRLRLTPEGERLHCGVCGSVLSGATAGFPCPRCHGSLGPWKDAEIAIHRTVQRIRSKEIIPLVAGEHTAQVPNAKRVELEDNFKAAGDKSKVNVLACSPTLEMGSDVGGLDAVVLRNIPPRPDNYAQRGGRAGRRSRVGVVVGYCRATPHDQYFFDKPVEMISGEVPAPSLALGNRDVILRHLNAVVFGLAEPGLAGRMAEYVSPMGEVKKDAVEGLITAIRAQFGQALIMARHAFGTDVFMASQFDEAALQKHLESLPAKIEDVFNRTARQVIQLRQALEAYYVDLKGQRAGTRAGELVARLLGIPTDRMRNQENADDRSAGYPLRRFAEFGILPGYEFPTEPSSLRLLGDENEEDPVTAARRFGITQFMPDVQVYARTKRWRVIGLDLSSPWNPRSDEPTWQYRACRACNLRYYADAPKCPRCGDASPAKGLPAAGYAGFLARRDETPVLDEEERYAARNLVELYPQWDGRVEGRWTVGPGWALRRSSGEQVFWLNEGLQPKEREKKEGLPILHDGAIGFLICQACGNLLSMPPVDKEDGGRRQPRTRSPHRMHMVIAKVVPGPVRRP